MNNYIKYLKYKNKYKQISGALWERENRDLLNQYKEQNINQEEFTRELFQRQYRNEENPFFYEKWAEHNNLQHSFNFLNNWRKTPEYLRLNDLLKDYSHLIKKPHLVGFYSPDENIEKFATDFHYNSMNWDNNRMEKWFRSSFFYNVVKQCVRAGTNDNTIYYEYYDQLRLQYPKIISLGILYDRLKILLEILGQRDRGLGVGKPYSLEGQGYISVSKYTDLVVNVVSMFISLWTVFYINGNIHMVKLDDLQFIYTLMDKMIREGNNIFIFYIDDISVQLFDN